MVNNIMYKDYFKKLEVIIKNIDKNKKELEELLIYLINKIGLAETSRILKKGEAYISRIKNHKQPSLTIEQMKNMANDLIKYIIE